MKSLFKFLSLSLLLLNNANATDKFPDYKMGEGAHYKMMVDNKPADVKMAFISRTDNILVIEMDMRIDALGAGIPIHMVQQFHLLLSGGKIKIAKGYMKIPNIPKPQQLPPEFLKGYDGAQMNNFLISSKSDIDGDKIGELKMQTSEGPVDAVHYRRLSNGQTVEFWITDDPKLKPLSLVQMKSSGKKKEHNYQLNLKGVVKGYKAQINASNSEPLNEMGRMFLPMLTNTSNFLN